MGLFDRTVAPIWRPGHRAAWGTTLLLPIGMLGFASASSAIVISEAKFSALGGNLGATPGTLPHVMSQLHARSLAPQFLAVGWMEGCTATWLGEDPRHTYLLSAAHCVNAPVGRATAVRRTFLDWRGRIVAQGDGWAARPPAWTELGYRDRFGDDLVVLRLPRVATPTDPWGQALTPPTMADTDLLAGEGISFVGYGDRGVGPQYRIAGSKEARAWGESVVGGFFFGDRGLYLRFEPRADSPSWAFPSFGDSGATLWRLQQGRWQMSGVHAAVSQLPERNHWVAIGAHLPRYASWVRSIFPGVVLQSDHMTATATRPFVSRNHAGDPSGRSVHYVVPAQTGVAGPSVGRSSGKVGTSRITVLARESRTGSTAAIRLRAQRETGCRLLPMEDATPCPASPLNRLLIAFDPRENPDLKPGAYTGSFDVEVLAWEDRSRRERLTVQLDIQHLLRGEVTAGKAFVSPDLAAPTPGDAVYFTVPLQAGAKGPAHGVWSSSREVSRIEVTTRDALSGGEHPIVLRAWRGPLCGQAPLRMESAVTCQRRSAGPVTVSFHPEDNRHLPAGLHRGRVTLQARAWSDRAFDQLIELDVELDTVEAAPPPAVASSADATGTGRPASQATTRASPSP